MAKSKKVSKWDAAPESIRMMLSNINALCDGLAGEGGSCEEAGELEHLLVSGLEDVLDEYNELEAKHNSDCGLISTLEADNDDLERELEKYKTIVKDLRHENEELETELKEKKNVIDEVEGHLKTLVDYLRDEWRFKVEYLPDIGTHNWHWHLKQVGPNQYNHNSNNFRYAFKEACRYIGMTPGQIINEVRWVRLSDTTERDIIDRWKRLSEQAKPLQDELKESCEKLEEKLKSAEYRCDTYRDSYERTADDVCKLMEFLKRYGVPVKYRNDDNTWYWDFENSSFNKAWDDTLMKDCKLIDKCRKLEKENKDLKDLLEKDGEFGKNIGKRVADSIREGCDKGVYKLHPLTRIDIHVEETNSIPIDMEFGRYAVPRVSVIFNNTQTEMERDTAQHECEELNEKTERLWRVNDELNRKIKELDKENKDLKTTLAMCERDANTAKNLCHNVAFNAERARNKTPWFARASLNSRYLRKPGDDA